MSMAPVAHTGKIAGSVSTSVTTDPVDTTLATILVIISHVWTADTVTPSDSNGNTWHSLTAYGQSEESGFTQIHYAYDHGGSALVVGSGHTFTISKAADDYLTITMSAHPGTLTTGDPFGQENGAHITGTHGHTGSITPGQTGMLLISGYSDGYSSTTDAAVDSPLAVTDTMHDGSHMSGAQAWYEDPNADAIDPGWTCATTAYMGISVASFKPGAGDQSLSPSSIRSGEAFGYDGALSGGAAPSVTNIWRRCPSFRLLSEDLVQQALAEAAYKAVCKFFEAPAGGPAAQNITGAGGIASEEAFGSSLFTMYLIPTGIAGAEAFGAALLQSIVSLLPGGIPSEEAFGGPQLNFALLAQGVVSGEAFGTSTFSLFLAPVGIGSQEAFGTALLQAINQLFPSGIPSGEAFGTALLNFFLSPAGIASLEAFGNAALALVLTISPSGIVGAEAFGTGLLNFRLEPSSIISQETFGGATFTIYALPAGIGSAEAFGTPGLTTVAIILPSGIQSAEAFGAALLQLFIQASAITSAEAFGGPIVQQLVGELAPVIFAALKRRFIQDAIRRVKAQVAEGEDLIQDAKRLTPIQAAEPRKFIQAAVKKEQ